MLRDVLIKKIIEDLGEQDSPKGPKLAIENEIEVLKGVLASFQKKYTFHVGMIVRQKHGCRYMKDCSDNGVAIVVEILTESLFENPSSSASCYYRRPLDMIIGYTREEGRFDLFHVDSRSFEPVKE